LAILFKPFGFIAPKPLNYLVFESFDFERTWWGLFRRRVVHPIDFLGQDQGHRVKFLPRNILVNTLESTSFNGF
jgi:hypothetical protein